MSVPVPQRDVALARVVSVYFNDPDRQFSVPKGTEILKQDGFNDRLYYLKSGLITGYHEQDDEEEASEVFQLEPGNFFGVHSFFARTLTASTTVVAETDCELAWIDVKTKAEDELVYGSIAAQFMPIIIDELAKRQQRTSFAAQARERAMKKLYLAEEMTTLGQLAAGIAHELNNAVGVLSSKTETLKDAFAELLTKQDESVTVFFDQGLMSGQSISSLVVRQRSRELEKKYHLGKEQARQLARAVPEGDVPDYWLDNLGDAIHSWELGRDVHDLRLAARHAVAIVRSVKQLAGADHERSEDVSINDTINKSLSLLQRELRHISVVIRPASNLPTIRASSSELVQIWVNIIKNAAEAMSGVESHILK